MDISVIIPTYRPEGYIWQCLDSLTVQSFSSECYEIIVVLNGFREPYFSAIRHYIEHSGVDVKITLLYSEVSGVSSARNLGLDVAQGRYITFVDDDDYVSEGYLEELFRLSCGGVMALSGYRDFVESGCREVEGRAAKFYRKWQGRERTFGVVGARAYLSGPVAKLFPREVIGEFRFDTRYRNDEDALFVFAVSKNIRRVVLSTPRAIYFRRIRDSSATKVVASRWQRLKHYFRKCASFLRIWSRAPLKYNFVFLLTRLAAGLKVVIKGKYNI